MSKIRKVLVAVLVSFVVLIALFVALTQLSPFVFDKVLVDAAFQDCVHIEAIGTYKSTDGIVAAVDSCAKKEGVYINNVSFKSFTPKTVTTVIEYSVPVAGFRLDRHTEKKFHLLK